MALLEVRNLCIQFGGLHAVSDVCFEVESNSIVGLIGPNGAGKTTVFNLLTNVYQPNSGSITIDNQPLRGNKTYEATQLGLARTFQNIRIFNNMSVLDNVMVAMREKPRYNILSALLRLPSYWRQEQTDREEAYELLRLFDMQDYAEQPAGSLPYGSQRKLEICRAMATHPKLLLLDEPAAGMNSMETEELMASIEIIMKDFDTSILLIEHDMRLVMGICQKIIVLNYGKLIAEGSPAEIRENPQVIGAYLGSEGRPEEV